MKLRLFFVIAVCMSLAYAAPKKQDSFVPSPNDQAVFQSILQAAQHSAIQSLQNSAVAEGNFREKRDAFLNHPALKDYKKELNDTAALYKKEGIFSSLPSLSEVYNAVKDKIVSKSERAELLNKKNAAQQAFTEYDKTLDDPLIKLKLREQRHSLLNYFDADGKMNIKNVFLNNIYSEVPQLQSIPESDLFKDQNIKNEFFKFKNEWEQIEKLTPQELKTFSEYNSKNPLIKVKEIQDMFKSEGVFESPERFALEKAEMKFGVAEAQKDLFERMAHEKSWNLPKDLDFSHENVRSVDKLYDNAQREFYDEQVNLLKQGEKYQHKVYADARKEMGDLFDQRYVQDMKKLQLLYPKLFTSEYIPNLDEDTGRLMKSEIENTMKKKWWVRDLPNSLSSNVKYYLTEAPAAYSDYYTHDLAHNIGLNSPALVGVKNMISTLGNKVYNWFPKITLGKRDEESKTYDQRVKQSLQTVKTNKTLYDLEQKVSKDIDLSDEDKHFLSSVKTDLTNDVITRANAKKILEIDKEKPSRLQRKKEEELLSGPLGEKEIKDAYRLSHPISSDNFLSRLFLSPSKSSQTLDEIGEPSYSQSSKPSQIFSTDQSSEGLDSDQEITMGDVLTGAGLLAGGAVAAVKTKRAMPRLSNAVKSAISGKNATSKIKVPKVPDDVQ